MVNLAAVLATVKFLTGERQAVWVKAESTRVISEPAPQETFVPATRVDFEPVARHDRVAK